MLLNALGMIGTGDDSESIRPLQAKGEFTDRRTANISGMQIHIRSLDMNEQISQLKQCITGEMQPENDNLELGSWALMHLAQLNTPAANAALRELVLTSKYWDSAGLPEGEAGYMQQQRAAQMLFYLLIACRKNG